MKRIKISLLAALCAVLMLASCNKSAESGATATNLVFEDFFEQSFMKNTSKKDLEDLKGMIHPEKGVYMSLKIGVAPVVKNYKNAADMLVDLPSLAADFSDAECKRPKNEALPEFDCADFSKKGCFFQESKGRSALQEAFKTSQSATGEPAADALAPYAAVDGMVTHTLVMTKSALQLHFAQIDGNWYLVFVDAARFDCGA